MLPHASNCPALGMPCPRLILPPPSCALPGRPGYQFSDEGEHSGLIPAGGEGADGYSSPVIPRPHRSSSGSGIIDAASGMWGLVRAASGSLMGGLRSAGASLNGAITGEAGL
jgi:hypothetical protein